MHSAPAVSYPVGRSSFQVWLVRLVLLLGAGVCALWIQQAGGLGWPQGLAIGCWLLAAFVAACSGYRARAGLLRWDGQNWQLESAGSVLPGRVLLRLDLQARVLLEFRPQARRPQWLWLERGDEPWRWEALRRALCARAAVASEPAPADPGGART